MLKRRPVTIPIWVYKYPTVVKGNRKGLFTRKIGYSTTGGFTLVELLVVAAIIGILASILAPVWLRFLAAHKVTAGKDQLRIGIQKAQLKSQQENAFWQLSIRENSAVVEMAVHPTTTPLTTAVWEPLGNSLQLDDETNFAEVNGIYYVRFDEKGNVQFRLGRVTLSDKNFPDIKRCVIVSTLVGNTRAAREQPVPRDGKICY